ncbi:MAG: hypothetical protein FD131_3192 [Rhodocyclaceae bacterium]|nr:MAG: hypothetical protein FD131_3192 [Rhodocyclaceae bacterium]
MTPQKDPLFTMFDSTELERDIALMDRVKEKFDMKSDRELSDMLGANKTVLSEIRSNAKAVANGVELGGKPRALTALQRLRAFDRLGYAWARDALMAAFPDSVREELVKSDNERTKAHVAADVEHIRQDPADSTRTAT